MNDHNPCSGLIHSSSPFLVEILTNAFSFAEKLGIPSILTPENVIDFSDEKSILTYISLIYKSFTGLFTFFKIKLLFSFSFFALFIFTTFEFTPSST